MHKHIASFIVKGAGVVFFTVSSTTKEDKQDTLELLGLALQSDNLDLNNTVCVNFH